MRGHPDVNGNLPSVLKALTRPEASGLKQALLNDWRNVDVTTKGGIFLGRRTAFEVDMNRIARVVQRIVRGLYYHEVNTPLSGGVKIVSNENLSEQEPDVIRDMEETIIKPLAAVVPKIIGRDAFSYRHWISPIDPAVSVWGLIFFSNVQFVALTGSDEHQEHHPSR